MNVLAVFIFLFYPNLISITAGRSVFTTLIENLFSTSLRKDSVNHTIVYGHSEKISDSDKISLPRVWLTVASTVDVDHNLTNYRNTSVIRAIEIHWQATPLGPSIGDSIEIYDINRKYSQNRPIKRYLLHDNKYRILPNYIKTDIEFPYLNETELDILVETKRLDPYETKHGKLSGRCLHFYAVYILSNQTVKSLYCIRLNSRWMEEEIHLMENRSLIELIIPGTHDSSSFEPYDLVNYEGNVLTRFQFTQDETLYSQLAYGIRYLDMRVGAYNITDTFSEWRKNLTGLVDGKQTFVEQLWTVHDIQRNHINLSQALEQIRRFVKRTSHEIIIVDFHRFVNGFDSFWDFNSIDQRLRHFYTLIVKFLGPYILPFTQHHNSTIGEMIRLNRRVIIGYAYKFDPRGYFDSDLFWPATEHLWAQTDKLATLKSFINREICLRRSVVDLKRGHLYSTMAEFTPNIDGILFRRYHGLRDLASLVNSYYDLWFRRKYWSCANIVSGDFFLGSDIVQIAIDVNRRRFMKT